ncbi:amino-acid N-acetyltransferase [Methylomonas sp. SURF-2]|uniref:Amino-acid acetyltransferase n=1 Tax=Methylomonas subterranea TaxID=2952225 RepID=A0ABT1TFW3_9GAMM|nr:amino-acid N-acetyltransferase [Methylomonas sp. SURF-2]MCQ8103639.1 amino-acid N-acetyltransferase [Methylomonas sp. SURF-2]
MQQPTAFVNWFRNSSPYIHAHRNRTFVIFFSGAAVTEPEFDNLIHDFALLKSLGVRLVLVHGIRQQIDERLLQQGDTPRFHHHLRITDAATLQYVKQAAGLVRVEIEALLSMGVSGSPMAGAKIRVASGNFVTAKPLGVLDGIDYCYTGKVRRIDTQAIHQQLDQNNAVLISPIGYSPSGEVFNLSAEEVATEVAIALHAEKLILLTDQACLSPEDNSPIPQLTADQASALLAAEPGLPDAVARSLNAAIQSCRQGVGRAHLINRHLDGALLLELFTRDGIGTLISSTEFEAIRPATLDDIGGIMELIKPLEQQGILIKRSREKLEMEINDYIVIERDGLIIGCTAFHIMSDKRNAEIACLAVHADYQRGARGNRLLTYLTRNAAKRGIQRLYVRSTQTVHWFVERGFSPCEIEDLPEPMKSAYNHARNSKVLSKAVD